MTFKATTHQALPAGVYPAVLDGIREGENDYGGFRRWRFSVTTPEGERMVTAMTSDASGPKSKAYKWASTLLGRKPGTDEEQLVGLGCQLHLIVNEEGFNRIEALLPPKATDDASTLNLGRLDDQVYASQEIPF
jgi:hypothetical protein